MHFSLLVAISKCPDAVFKCPVFVCIVVLCYLLRTPYVHAQQTSMEFQLDDERMPPSSDSALMGDEVGNSGKTALENGEQTVPTSDADHP